MKISRKEFNAAINVNFGGRAVGFRKGENKTQNVVKEQANVVHLSGKVHGVWMKEKSAFALIDVGMKNFVPCTLYGEDDSALAEKLDKFSKGDSIQLVGYVNPWAVKDDSGQWQRKLDIRITEIRTEPPKRSQKHNEPPQGWMGSDNDIPF